MGTHKQEQLYAQCSLAITNVYLNNRRHFKKLCQPRSPQTLQQARTHETRRRRAASTMALPGTTPAPCRAIQSTSST